MENCKKALIVKYVVPALGNLSAINNNFIDDLTACCRLIHALKYQQLETPGPFEEAYIWFSVEAMVHSYYYCPHKLVKKGTRIWKKREFILFSGCLLRKEQRTDYIEILEPGDVICIKYADLISLIERYPELEKPVKMTSIDNERCYHHRSLLLNKPVEERVKCFVAENKFFVRCTSQAIQAMHVNLSLRGYTAQLAKLKQ